MFYATTFLSVTGNVLASLAIPWFVLQTTGSAAQTGITAFFSILPVVIGTAFGGTLVDRMGYKRASIIADVASGLTVALIPLLFALDLLPFWGLLTLVFLGALLDAPGNSARFALIPETAALAGISLDRATGINGLLQRATSLAGAPAAGLLIASIGAINLLWFNAATFFVSAIGIAIAIPTDLVEAEIDPEANKSAPKTSYWQELRDGFRFVKQDALILSFIGVIMLTNMTDAAIFSVMLPVYTSETYGVERGATLLGFAIGMLGGGAVIGSLIYTTFVTRLPRRKTFTLCFLLIGFYPLLLSTPLPPLLLLIGFTIMGLFASPLNPIIQSVMYERVPQNMRGRVFGLTTSGVQIAMPFGALIAGYAVEIAGLPFTVIGFSIVSIFAVFTLTVNPAMKDMANQPVAASGNVEL